MLLICVHLLYIVEISLVNFTEARKKIGVGIHCSHMHSSPGELGNYCDTIVRVAGPYIKKDYHIVEVCNY